MFTPRPILPVVSFASRDTGACWTGQVADFLAPYACVKDLTVYIQGVYTEPMNETTKTTCVALKCTHEVNAEVSPWCDNHRPEWALVVTTDPTPWRYWPQWGNEVREIRFATQRDASAYGAAHAVYAPRADGFELAEGVR